MVIAWVGFRMSGLIGFPPANSWVSSLRFALAAMFLFTATSHFVPRTRAELIRMVPASLPRAPLLVTLTGLLEGAGAVGMLIPALLRPASLCLALMLMALFPANIRAAREGLMVGGRPAMPLRFRLPLQLFWIGLLIWVAARGPGSHGAGAP
jgi:uncharacterized membrane protein